MTVQVSVNGAGVQFVRDRKTAKALCCAEVVTVPIGQISGAWLIDEPNGGGHLRVLPLGGDTTRPPEADPFSAYFDQITLPAARGVLDRIHAEKALPPSERSQAPGFTPADDSSKMLDRLATGAMWIEGVGLAFGLIGLLLFAGVAVFLAIAIL